MGIQKSNRLNIDDMQAPERALTPDEARKVRGGGIIYTKDPTTTTTDPYTKDPYAVTTTTITTDPTKTTTTTTTTDPTKTLLKP